MRRFALLLAVSVVGLVALNLRGVSVARADVDRSGNATVAPFGIGPDSQPHQLKTDTDGTLNVRNVLTTSCTNPRHSVVSLTAGVSTAVPGSALAGRSYVQITNSKENTGSPLVKCTIDGQAAVMGTTHPGDVFAPGDGNLYPIPSTLPAACTTDTTGTVVSVLEC